MHKILSILYWSLMPINFKGVRGKDNGTPNLFQDFQKHQVFKVCFGNYSLIFANQYSLYDIPNAFPCTHIKESFLFLIKEASFAADTITKLYNWSDAEDKWSWNAQSLLGHPQPNLYSLGSENITEECKERMEEPGPGSCCWIMSSRQDKDAAVMAFQQYGYLKKTWIKTTPVDIPVWMGKISQHPISRWRATENQRQLRKRISPHPWALRLSNIKWSALSISTCEKH